MASYATVEQLDATNALPSGTEDPGYASGEPLFSQRQLVLDAATNLIDAHCARSFTVAGANPSERMFRPYYRNPRRGSRIITDDFAEVPTVVSDGGTTIPSTEWFSQRAPTSERAGYDLTFPVYNLSGGVVTITARWGWPEVPAPIVQACLLMGAKIFMQQKSPLGIFVNVSQAETAMAYLPKRDTQVMALLEPYMRARII